MTDLDVAVVVVVAVSADDKRAADHAANPASDFSVLAAFLVFFPLAALPPKLAACGFILVFFLRAATAAVLFIILPITLVEALSADRRRDDALDDAFFASTDTFIAAITLPRKSPDDELRPLVPLIPFISLTALAPIRRTANRRGVDDGEDDGDADGDTDGDTDGDMVITPLELEVMVIDGWDGQISDFDW